MLKIFKLESLGDLPNSYLTVNSHLVTIQFSNMKCVLLVWFYGWEILNKPLVFESKYSLLGGVFSHSESWILKYLIPYGLIFFFLLFRGDLSLSYYSLSVLLLLLLLINCSRISSAYKFNIESKRHLFLFTHKCLFSYLQLVLDVILLWSRSYWS